MAKVLTLVFLFLALVVCSARESSAQTTQFTFQGSLKDGAAAANGNYDFEFALFEELVAGKQIGTDFSINGVAVANGIFSVKLDFGSVFRGANRFLEVRVRLAGQPGFTTLTPRQMVNSAPYSLKSLNADIATSAETATNATTANNALQLGGVAANQYVITTDPRMTNARNPLPNSANYIWNQNAVLQTSSNFVISGNGFIGGTLEANVVDAATRYNIGGSRVLSIAGIGNVFAGVGAGQGNTTGDSNSFFGSSAGINNLGGDSNSFFGRDAGLNNTTGGTNSFFGRSAGLNNVGGGSNSFFGYYAGAANTGSFNSFFGTDAGRGNTGVYNSFFGAYAGRLNTTGDENSFFGTDAGNANAEGYYNSFFGRSAGVANTEGHSNSFFGRYAGLNNTMGDENAFFGSSAGRANTTGNENAFFGTDAGRANTQGFGNSFFGQSAGDANTSGYANVFLGRRAGFSNTIGNNNTIIGDNANVASGELTYATAIGAGSIVSTSNTLVIGRFLDDVRVPGNLAVTTLGAGGATAICRNVSQQISTCSSSIRYKENIDQFKSGMGLVNKLRPVAFDWKDGGTRDVGFVAEDVAESDSRFVTFNDKGEVEGVKYDRLSVAFVNAFKEQQKQIEDLQQQIKEQKAENDAFKELVCLQNPTAKPCLSRK